MTSTATNISDQNSPTASRKRVRRRRMLNTPLLLMTLVVLGACSAVGYFWHRHQKSITTDALLERAVAYQKDEEWAKATSYYQRYLMMVPGDLETRVDMVQSYAQGIQDPRGRRRLTTLLYHTLGFAPQRDDLRMQLAENLLQVGDYAAAEVEANKLLESPDHKKDAWRVLAISRYARARADGPITMENAAKALLAALADQPGNVQLAAITAQVLRANPKLEILHGADAAGRADQIMDQMVAANREDGAALLARYRYRKRYAPSGEGQPNAGTDLGQALKLDPDNVEALLLAAAEALSSPGKRAPDATGPTSEVAASEGTVRAQQILEHVVETAPTDSRGYLALAQVFLQTGQFDRAEQILRSGLGTIERENPDMLVALGLALLASGKQDEAAKVIEQLDRTLSGGLLTLPTETRRRLENRLRLLRARLALAKGSLEPAVRNLKGVLATVESKGAGAQSAESLQALELLARTMTALNRWDASASYWDQLTTALPGQARSLRMAAEAHLKQGQADETIDRLERFQQITSSGLSLDLQVMLVQAHLLRQTRMPAAERNWSEFQSALAAAKEADAKKTDTGEPASTGWELPLIETGYLRAIGNTPKHQQQAARLLQAAESRFGGEIRFWRGLVMAYLNLDLPADTDRALTHYETLEPSLLNRVILRAGCLAYGKEYDEAEACLTGSLPQLATNERLQAQLQRLRIMTAAGKSQPAWELVGQLVKEYPQNEKLLQTGIELALQRGDDTAAERLEAMLSKINRQSEFAFNYLRARRSLAKYNQVDAAGRRDLSRFIKEMLAERPRWYPGVALAAQYAEVTGDRKRALAGYRRAVELGDVRAITLERLVSLLYQKGRYNDAQRYLSQLTTIQPDSERTQSLEIALAVRQDRVAEALEIARKSLKNHPDDAMHHVWLGILLAIDGQATEGERMMRDAVARFGDDTRVWSGLFVLLEKTGQHDQARQVLSEMASAAGLDEPMRHFLAAQGYQMLGDVADSRREYEAAVRIAPENLVYRLGLAKLLLSIDVSAATAQYKRILKQDPNQAHARRYLATLLAMSGDDAGYQLAMDQLQQGGNNSEGSGGASQLPDNRLRAILLARRGKTRAERLVNINTASRILEQQLGMIGNETNDIDRLLLAGIYERKALLDENPDRLQEAREQLRHLVDRAEPTANYLRRYIDFLLRHVQSLRKAGNSPVASRQARIQEVFLKDARSRLPDYDAALRREGAETQSLPWHGLQVRLLMAEGREEEALAAIDAFAQAETGRMASENGDKDREDKASARFYLGIGSLYTSIGQHERAESWYRKLLSVAPGTYALLVQSLASQGKMQEAAEVCLEAAGGKPSANAATILARLLTTSGKEAVALDEVQPLIRTALENEGDNVELLMSVAVMHVSRGNSEEAIRLLRRVVELAPKQTLALNNLATLLAEQPDGHAEALEMIGRAMAIAGRQPALLDTQGTIYLQSGEPAQAIAGLEEAVAGGASDPRYYFHLAAAYHASGNTESAAAALKKARSRGLDTAILTTGDQKLLAGLNQKFPPEKLEN